MFFSFKISMFGYGCARRVKILTLSQPLTPGLGLRLCIQVLLAAHRSLLQPGVESLCPSRPTGSLSEHRCQVSCGFTRDSSKIEFETWSTKFLRFCFYNYQFVKCEKMRGFYGSLFRVSVGGLFCFLLFDITYIFRYLLMKDFLYYYFSFWCNFGRQFTYCLFLFFSWIISCSKVEFYKLILYIYCKWGLILF